MLSQAGHRLPADYTGYTQENQHLFPAIAALAQDILSIPATGAGFARLCYTARDICHHRRGHLNSTTT
jgi:hypothetical protein